MFWGKGVGKAQKYMKPAWDNNKVAMTKNAFKEAIDIAARAIKRHEKRLHKILQEQSQHWQTCLPVMFRPTKSIWLRR